ncbi:MAG: hypothetical protein IKU90_00130 [Clostridia bacterium]|nr:hypothetical protein [Clostridia bacterium]
MSQAALIPVTAVSESTASEKETRTIYIILSQTGTILSRILKYYTRAPYNHASIALTKELDEMYSFGRLDPYNPFVGGFVQESPFFGTFKRFKNTRAKIIEATVTAEAYHELRAHIRGMAKQRKEYSYNYGGLFLASVRIHRAKRNAYYCSEFVKAMAVQAGVEGADAIPAIVKPMHLLSVPHKVVYEGFLRDYPLLRRPRTVEVSV